MDFTSALLRGSERAVGQYNEMSSAMWAPEGYIRDMCAMDIHQQLGIPVSTELPCRYFKELWRLDESEYIELRNQLGNLKVDLVAHRVSEEGEHIVTALVEFKLTAAKAEEDIERLRALVRMAESKRARAKGYVVICRQPYPHQEHVREEFDGKKYAAGPEGFAIDVNNKSLNRDGHPGRGRWPFWVAVIDVDDDAP